MAACCLSLDDACPSHCRQADGKVDITDDKRPGSASPNPSPVASTRFCCPCCGYPDVFRPSLCTETCSLCLLGRCTVKMTRAQTRLRGGPNYRLSLTAARENFRNHLTKYDADDPMSEPYSVRELEARRAMLAALEGMKCDCSIERYCRSCGDWVLDLQASASRGTDERRLFDHEWMRQRRERQWAYWERLYGKEWVEDRLRKYAAFRQRKEAARASHESLREPEAPVAPSQNPKTINEKSAVVPENCQPVTSTTEGETAKSGGVVTTGHSQNGTAKGYRIGNHGEAKDIKQRALIQDHPPWL